MHLRPRLRRLETRSPARPVATLPKALRDLLPLLDDLDDATRRRVLAKESDRLTLHMAFTRRIIPGVFTLELDEDQVGRATQAMLDAVYPGTPSPRDVEAGDIEQVVREKIDAWRRHYHDLRVRFGYHHDDATEDLLAPTVGEPLRETALGRPFGIGFARETVTPT